MQACKQPVQFSVQPLVDLFWLDPESLSNHRLTSRLRGPKLKVLLLEGWRGWRAGGLEAGGTAAGWKAGLASLVGDVAGVAGIRYGASLPNRTETPQYWQYIYH